MAILCFVIQAGPQEIWPDGVARRQTVITEDERWFGPTRPLFLETFINLGQGILIEGENKLTSDAPAPGREPNQIRQVGLASSGQDCSSD